MPRRNKVKIDEIKKIYSEKPWSDQIRTQELAYYLLKIRQFNRCDVIAAGAASRKQVDAVRGKIRQYRPLNHTGRYGSLRSVESSVLTDWLLFEMKHGRFHHVFEVRNKVYILSIRMK
jgi:hypothetical protein